MYLYKCLYVLMCKVRELGVQSVQRVRVCPADWIRFQDSLCVSKCFFNALTFNTIYLGGMGESGVS